MEQINDNVIAVNPNPAANGNITTQLNEMDDAVKEKASESLNSEIPMVKADSNISPRMIVISC